MTGRKSVLIVEDEVMIGMMLEDYLDELGYDSAGVAATLEEALDRAREGGFDAAILDCNLAGSKVWDLADLLAQGDVPFLFASGGMQGEIPSQHSARPTLSKPYNIAALEEALSGIMG